MTTHRHHFKHHIDDSERFKQESFLSMRRRKALGRFLYVFMFILALLITAVCVVVTFWAPN